MGEVSWQDLWQAIPLCRVNDHGQWAITKTSSPIQRACACNKSGINIPVFLFLIYSNSRRDSFLEHKKEIVWPPYGSHREKSQLPPVDDTSERKV